MRWLTALILVLFVIPELPALEGGPGDEAEPYCFSFTLINDNLPFFYFKDERPDFMFNGGPDDAFTFAIRLEAAWPARFLIFDAARVIVLLNAFTWHIQADDNFRVDYLSGLWWLEGGAGIFFYGALLGFNARGNFGGSLIQNAFHALINWTPYPTAYLPESDFKAGPLFGAKLGFNTALFNLAGFALSGALYSRGLWDALSAGRSSLWLGAGLQADSDVLLVSAGGGYRLSPHTGDTLLNLQFSGGIFLFGRFVIKLVDFAFGLGIALNAYGNAPVAMRGYERWDNRHYFFFVVIGDVARTDPLDNFLP